MKQEVRFHFIEHNQEKLSDSAESDVKL